MPPGAIARGGGGSYVPPTARSLPSPAEASAAPGQTIVLQVVIEGVKNPEKNVPKLKTRSGEPYDAQVVEDDVKMLLKSRKFVDVSPRVQPVNGGVVVIFQIVERPTIKYIRIVGCENTLKSSLESKTDLKVKDGLDPYAIKEARDKLESYYHDHGYDRVRVMIAEGLSPGDQGVVFLDRRRPEAKNLEDQFRRQQVHLRRSAGDADRFQPAAVVFEIFLGRFKGEADRKKIDEDVEKLTAYYRAFGFFQAKDRPDLELRRRRKLDVSDVRHQRRSAIQSAQYFVHRKQECSRRPGSAPI